MNDRTTTSPAPPPPRPPLLTPAASVGEAVYFALRATAALPAAALRPNELLMQLYRILSGAVPLGIVAGIAIGTVVWMQLRGVLINVGGPGAVQYLPRGLSLSVVLVLGPVISGLLSGARTGAALGAELGSMRQTEQIDALEVLGLSPLRELVAPRVVACMISMPVMTTFTIYLALATGLVGEAFGGGMTARRYVSECLRVLTLSDVLPALGKTVVYGYLIGLAGCWHGMSTQGGTEGVGRAATRAVVHSLFAVLIAEVVLTRLIKLVF